MLIALIVVGYFIIGYLVAIYEGFAHGQPEDWIDFSALLLLWPLYIAMEIADIHKRWKYKRISKHRIRNVVFFPISFAAKIGDNYKIRNSKEVK